MTVKVVNVFDPFPNNVEQTIFLAGPTPRSPEVPSWRPEALRLLRAAGFTGHVFVPEVNDQSTWHDGFEAQEEWEDAALQRADVLLFWVPRDFTPDSRGQPRMAAATTSIEFGEYMKSGRVVLGAPPQAMQTGAMRKKAERYSIPVFTELPTALHQALLMLGAGAVRTGWQCGVPLNVWQSPAFKYWLANSPDAKRCQSVRVVWQHVGRDGNMNQVGLEAVLSEQGTPVHISLPLANRHRKFPTMHGLDDDPSLDE